MTHLANLFLQVMRVGRIEKCLELGLASDLEDKFLVGGASAFPRDAFDELAPFLATDGSRLSPLVLQLSFK